jgi:hypothetical protein
MSDKYLARFLIANQEADLREDFKRGFVSAFYLFLG